MLEIRKPKASGDFTSDGQIRLNRILNAFPCSPRKLIAWSSPPPSVPIKILTLLMQIMVRAAQQTRAEELDSPAAGGILPLFAKSMPSGEVMFSFSAIPLDATEYCHLLLLLLLLLLLSLYSTYIDTE